MQKEGKLGKSGRAAAALALLLLASPVAHATTSLKQVQVSNGSQVDLLFDSKVQKGQVRVEYSGDVIQLNIQDASVYPAKISSVNGASLTKIFVYQYAPKLVRCRLTVKGKAEDFRGKLEVKTGGRILTVRMPSGSIKATVGKSAPSDETLSTEDAEEKALLNRVMAASAKGAVPSGAAAPAGSPGALTKASAAPAVAASDSGSTVSKSAADSITASASAPAAGSPMNVGSTENLPIHLTGESSSHLAGAKPLPSPLKAFGKMGIVLGIFGLFALMLKRYAQGRNEARLGDGLQSTISQAAQGEQGGWLRALGRAAKKGLSRNPKMIEVLSTHYLGPKKSIAVVRIAGRVLVLGVSNESINLITQLSGEEGADPFVGGDALGVADSLASGGAFDELLRNERAKPASPARPASYAAKTGASAYAAAAQSMNTGGQKSAGVRAQIRSRLEGLKQL